MASVLLRARADIMGLCCGVDLVLRVELGQLCQGAGLHVLEAAHVYDGLQQRHRPAVAALQVILWNNATENTV